MVKDSDILVRLKKSYRLSDERPVFQDLHRELKAKSFSPNQIDLFPIYVLKTTGDVLSLAEELKRDPDVEYAEPNYLALTSYRPNDPLYSQQWAHQNTHAESGWNLERGNANAVIAIIDTGVDYRHEDLSENIWHDVQGNPGKDFVDIDTAAYTFQGFSLFSGEDYTGIDNDPADYMGHGTHTAGIAAATGDNNRGVAGVCLHCKIMPVRAGFAIHHPLGDFGILEYDDIASAIKYAADQGARVISMSFGGYSDSATLHEAINYAYSLGAVLVAAAGNESSYTPTYPASYDHVISVVALARNNLLAFYSNYGSWVDVAAPGGDSLQGLTILSTVPRIGVLSDASGYKTLQGTSMATPYVAGVAGLIFSAYPTLANEQVRQKIEFTADDLGLPGKDSTYGYGQVNVYHALAGTIVISSPSDNSFLKGAVEIRGQATARDFNHYELSYAPVEYPESTVMITSSTLPKGEENSLLGIWPTAGVSDGVYLLTLKVVTQSGELKHSIFVSIDNVNQPPVFLTANQGAVPGRLLQFKVEAKDPDQPGAVWSQLAYSSDDSRFDPATQLFTWNVPLSQDQTQKVKFTVRDPDNVVSKEMTIYILRLTEETIAAEQYSQNAPQIDADNIVYYSNESDGYKVYLYKIPTREKTLLTPSAGSFFRPSIDLNKVVYEKLTTFPNSALYGYDLSTRQATLIGSGKSPSLSGNLVTYYDDRNGLTPPWSDIYAYDLASRSETKITNAQVGDWGFADQKISGDKIIYTHREVDASLPYLQSDYVIYLYNWLTRQVMPLTDGSRRLKGSYPAIDGDLIAFEKYDVANSQYCSGNISTYRISNGEIIQLTNNSLGVYRLNLFGDICIDHMLPDINGNKIVWSGKKTSAFTDYNIYLYDLNLGMEAQITNASGIAQGAGVVSGNRIVWENGWGGNNTDISMATVNISPELTSITPTSVPSGGSITLKGKNFGVATGESKVVLNNDIILPTISWSDSEIVSRIPANASSSLVHVVTSFGKSNDLNLTIDNSKHPPILNPIGDRSVAEGQLLSFTISATDQDNDILKYSVTGLPSGAQFSEQTFQWTSGFDQAGSSTVTFTVSDGQLSDFESVTITVTNVELVLLNLNDSPDPFSPDGDDVDDTTTITASFNHVANWALVIKNAAGTVIRNFNGSGTDVNQIWDGGTSPRSLLVGGTYTYVLTASDAGGSSVSGSGTVTMRVSRWRTL
ncbi:MAG: S8 family serine peptidase [Candidatus Vogelbacteria bacterium]|nr:S8 family serine peptidase [Candidatus Vogelbacteria bacterium]